MKNPKHILITGASSGIGEALALHYAAPGIVLFLSGRNETRLEAVRAACAAEGARADAKTIDVADKDAMRAWIGACDDDAPLDLVFANAGIGIEEKDAGLERAATETFAVNVGGVFNTIFPAIERMRPRRRGQIALISSLAAYQPAPAAPSYGASKAAVKAYGEALRGSLEPDGIEICVVNPGFVKSRITDRNDFPMPFLWPAHKAARVISRRLARNRGRISFPWPMVALVWTVRNLPMGVIDFVARRVPK